MNSGSISQQHGWDGFRPGKDPSGELWMWCLRRDILLTTQYLPGRENVTADRESRVMKDRSDWMLNPMIFQRVMDRFWKLEVDLFAT